MQELTLEYIRTSKLSLCYTDEHIQKLLDWVPTEGAIDVLLSIERCDAVRACVGLLATADAVEVAKACAERAKGYAADAYAAHVDCAAATYATYATYAAADAADAYAASYAADAASASAVYASACAAAHAAYAAARADYARASAEFELTIRDCVKRLRWEP